MGEKLDYRDEAVAGREEVEKAVTASLLHTQGWAGAHFAPGMEGVILWKWTVLCSPL